MLNMIYNNPDSDSGDIIEAPECVNESYFDNYCSLFS